MAVALARLVGDFRTPTFFDAMTGRSLGTVCPNPPDNNCVATLFRTSDGGTTWSQEPTGLALPSGGGNQQFLTPELAWRVTGQQSGIAGPSRHDFYRYDGNRPFVTNQTPETHRVIAPPDAGAGPAAPSHDLIPVSSWLLLAGAATFVTGGALRRRHAR